MAPKFTEKLKPQHSPDGGTVTFECRVDGSPRPLITWFRQTAIIKPSPDFQARIFFFESLQKIFFFFVMLQINNFKFNYFSP